ncbi:MAG: hypothetical protein ACE5OZ_06185 [Candidatus Heimdallarchaeota archaeon]
MTEKAGEGIVTTTKLNGDDVLRAVNEAWQRTVKYIYRTQSTSQEVVRKANDFFKEIIRDLEYNANRLSGTTAPLKHNFLDTVRGFSEFSSIKISGLIGALADLVNKRVAGADSPTVAHGVIFLLNSLESVLKKVNGVAAGNLIEIMRLSIWQQMIWRTNIVGTLPGWNAIDQLASMFLAKTEEENILTLMELNRHVKTLQSGPQKVLDIALNKHANSLGEIFRQLDGLKTIDELTGLAATQMGIYDIVEVAIATQGSRAEIPLPYADETPKGRIFDDYADWENFAQEYLGKKDTTIRNQIKAWRQRWLSRVVWHQYYALLKEYLKLGQEGKIRYLNLISEQDGTIRTTLINLVDIPKNFNWKDYGKIGQQWSTQKFMDDIMRDYSIAILDAATATKKGYHAGTISIKHAVSQAQMKKYKKTPGWRGMVDVRKLNRLKGVEGASNYVL